MLKSLVHLAGWFLLTYVARGDFLSRSLPLAVSIFPYLPILYCGSGCCVAGSKAAFCCPMLRAYCRLFFRVACGHGWTPLPFRPDDYQTKYWLAGAIMGLSIAMSAACGVVFYLKNSGEKSLITCPPPRPPESQANQEVAEPPGAANSAALCLANVARVIASPARRNPSIWNSMALRISRSTIFTVVSPVAAARHIRRIGFM